MEAQILGMVEMILRKNAKVLAVLCGRQEGDKVARSRKRFSQK